MLSLAWLAFIESHLRSHTNNVPYLKDAATLEELGLRKTSKKCAEMLWNSVPWADVNSRVQINYIMWACSSSESSWQPRWVPSKWIFHYDLLKYCNSKGITGKAPDPLSLLFWTSPSKPYCWISLQVSCPNTNPFCLLTMKFYVTVVLLMSLSHIYSFQPRTCTLVPLTVGNGTRAKDDPVPPGSITSPCVVITTRHKGSHTQRHIKIWKWVKNTPKGNLFSFRSGSHKSA